MSTNTESHKLSVAFGAIADPISDQLEGYLPDSELNRFDKLADAVTLLVISGVITDSAATACRRKIMAKITKAITDAH